ncbi:MAG TPA: ABC transporter permease [Candidatus Saccharimonadales bacterium]
MFKRVFSKKNRVLLAELVRTDFKLRYQGSVLGYAWSLLRPLLIFVILYIVFVKFLKVGAGTPHYAQYLLFGIVIWNFFAEMTLQSLGSIVGRGDLIRKIRIPRWIIVLSSSLSALINLFLNLVIITIFMVIGHVEPSSKVFLLPLLLGEVYLFALGISFFLSAAFVKYRDVSYIWEVCLQAGFYLTPILYPLSRITNVTFQKLLLLNPMAQALQDSRYVLITKKAIIPNHLFNGGWFEYIPIMIVAIVLFIGIAYFKKQSRYFAENI